VDVEVIDQPRWRACALSVRRSSRTVLRVLHVPGHSLPANVKGTEGRQHPDRDAQFRCLNDTAQAFIDDGQPAISVDTKKKELIGDRANGGAEWSPERVRRVAPSPPRSPRTVPSIANFETARTGDRINQPNASATRGGSQAVAAPAVRSHQVVRQGGGQRRATDDEQRSLEGRCRGMVDPPGGSGGRGGWTSKMGRHL
jgi:hypothetical protein